jgi:CelD/BcsL family acetyltransferase involved in cellulose biosynthesis
MGPRGIDVDVLPVRALAPAELSAWRRLAAAAIEPNPFFEPDVVLPAAAGLGDRGVGLLVARAGERWLASLPVRRRARWNRLPLPALATWRHDYCFLGTPLVDADGGDGGLRALVEHARRNGRDGLVVLERLADGPVHDELMRLGDVRGLGAHVIEEGERATLHRRPAPTYIEEAMPSRRRRELRRLRRLLEAELGAPLTVTDRSDDPSAVDEFLALEASGWKGRAGTAFASRRGHAEFFAEMCLRMAASGRLQLLSMEAGGRLVAMKCNLRAGDHVYCFKIAYEEEFARFSPGVQLEVDNVGLFHTGPATFIDSCADSDNEMINRLWPDRRSLRTLLIPTAGGLGWVSARSLPSVLAWRERRGVAA